MHMSLIGEIDSIPFKALWEWVRLLLNLIKGFIFNRTNRIRIRGRILDNWLGFPEFVLLRLGATFERFFSLKCLNCALNLSNCCWVILVISGEDKAGMVKGKILKQE